MRELAIVVLAFVALAAIAYGVEFVAEPSVYQLAWLLMTVLGLVAVVAESIYFAALFASLQQNGEVPKRWYARSFEHHHRLSPRQRWLVLPFFWLGFVGLSASFFIAVLLAFASFGMFQELRRA